MRVSLSLRCAILALGMLCLSSGSLRAQQTIEGISFELARLFDRHSAALLLVDADTGEILRANGAASEFYGYPPAELEKLRIDDLNAQSPDELEHELALAAREQRDHLVYRHRLANGDVRSVELRNSAMRWAGRKTLIFVVTDISERVELSAALARLKNQSEATIAYQVDQIRESSRLIEIGLGSIALAALALVFYLWIGRRRLLRAEADLREEKQRLDNVVRVTDIGTWELSVDTGELVVNERFLSLTGLQKESREPKTLADIAELVHEDDVEKIHAALIENLKGVSEYIDDELRIAHSDGHWIWLQLHGGVVRRDSSGRALLLAGAMRDVTSRKSRKDHLYQLANYDSLTGLPNRTALLERLRTAMEATHENGQQLAIAFIDLDDFKPVNERYGHIIGDEILISIGKRMLGVMRECDTVARLGGDEFVALINDVGDESEAQGLFKRLLQAASEPVAIGKHRIHLNASMGTTRYPQAHSLDADQLLRQADQAMYDAKNSGKNRIRSFDVGSLETASHRRRAVSAVLEAIDARELCLHYQPKVNMRSGELIGVEALLRWQHPERGLLLPGEFLPFLDSAADITRLGEWVLQEALEQCSRWIRDGFPCPVSVNIDVLQFKRPDFTTRLSDLLGNYPGVPEGFLELEILETGALEEDVLASGALRRCREMGLRISLDDFGTGFSSLSYLKSVPAETLKIDRSFVMSMLTDPNDLSIIQGVLGLAQAFNRECIAEGVESEEHGKLLLRLGCELGQGFAIAKALPASELRDWHQSWRAPDSWTRALPIPREEHLVLYAEVEMRNWRELIGAYLEGGGPPPFTARSTTGLGGWLKGTAARALRGEPEVLELHRCHNSITMLLGDLQKTPMPRATDEIYEALRDQCNKAEDELGRLVERNAFMALGSRLRLVSKRHAS
ncbi:MAG: EAL domain-containing protein [Pseudomonadota bacterium]